MAKSDSSGSFIAIVIIVSAASAAWKLSIENWPIMAGIGILIFAIIILRFYLKYKAHLRWVATLKEKYGDEEIVKMIVDGQFWRGQTAAMLIDSLGHPEAKEDYLLKTKRKCIWKYGHKHSNHYSLRITLENDVVSEWVQK